MRIARDAMDSQKEVECIYSIIGCSSGSGRGMEAMREREDKLKLTDEVASMSSWHDVGYCPICTAQYIYPQNV
jgi:hypothetical protein